MPWLTSFAGLRSRFRSTSPKAVLVLPPPFEDARPKRLRFAVFNLPARLVSHARRLLARVGRSLLERADLLVGRSRLRVAHAHAV